MVSCASALALNCVMRSSQPTGVTQVSIQASSAWAGTEDCTMTEELVGIDAGGEKQAGRLLDFRAQFRGRLVRGDGVQIDDAE